MVPSRILTWVLVSLNYYTDGLNHSATKAGLLFLHCGFGQKPIVWHKQLPRPAQFAGDHEKSTRNKMQDNM